MTRLHAPLVIAPALALVLAGCSIPYADVAARQVNTCESSSDCGPDAVCAPFDAGAMCVSTKADLADAIFEIRTSGSGKDPGRKYLVEPSALGVSLQSSALGGPVEFNPLLPELVSITTGQVSCIEKVGDDKMMKSIPAKVEFTRAASIRGPEPEAFTASPETKAGIDGTYEFHLDVIPGNYDIYVTPASPSTCGGATLPPVFIPSKLVEVNTTFSLLVEPARNLTGSIQAPMSLDGWSLQVFDMVSGRLISDTQTLSHKSTMEPASIDLHYNLTTGVEPILRLSPPSPPEGEFVASPLPSVYWDVAAADLQGEDKVNLVLSDLSVTPRPVDGVVFDADEATVIATVTFQSISLSSDTFKNAAITVQTDTDASGYYKVEVPPGSYRVTAKPVNDTETQAIFKMAREVPEGSECFCGQSITLPRKVRLEGEVSTPAQEPLLNASVSARPSLSVPLSQLERELGGDKGGPRVQTKKVIGGQFSLPLDPGEYDFSVEPPLESGYPWIARPRLTVQPDSDELSSSMGAIEVAYPVVVTGVVTEPSRGPAGGATIRVWLPVTDASGEARTAIQIGTAIADEAGRYTLLLPPSISQ